MPKRNEIDIWVIGGGGFSYFLNYRASMNQKRFNANLINKLSYFYIFNMNCKSMNCKGILKMDVRIAKR